jgi:Uma2 family endonuclease
MEASTLRDLTVTEYLDIEREHDQRYEYHDGFIYALAGGSINHNRISGNSFGTLRGELRNGKKDCEVFINDVKVHIASSNSYLYPDVMVVCGDIETAEHNKESITNPVLIIEVLSESTASYDRGDKFHKYRQIPSLVDYVLIEQTSKQVDVFHRDRGGDLWKISSFTGGDVHLASLDLTLALETLYEGVVFEE